MVTEVMPVMLATAMEVHETLSQMDDAFTTNPLSPVHATIGVWDVVRNQSGWHVDVAVYETVSFSAVKAWLILRCTELFKADLFWLHIQRSAPAPRMRTLRKSA